MYNFYAGTHFRGSMKTDPVHLGCMNTTVTSHKWHFLHLTESTGSYPDEFHKGTLSVHAGNAVCLHRLSYGTPAGCVVCVPGTGYNGRATLVHHPPIFFCHPELTT